MDAVMCLRPGATIKQTQALLKRHKVQASPMHPGVDDAAMSLWYVLSGPGDTALRAVVTALQSHPAVDAAMLKPAGEAPG